MRPSIRLFRVFGIDIGLHYSWFVIALLIVFFLSGDFQRANPQGGAGIAGLLAVATALLFFASILVHELSHAAVANARGMPVKSITLFALGGVANVERESTDAKSEFFVAIVGPLTSLSIGLFFYAIAGLAGWRFDSGTPSKPLLASMVWLGYINMMIAAFNMIPGYPLDGGRVLRSIIWLINRDVARATKIAAGIGQFVAIAFIVAGMIGFLYTGAIGGLWLAFIGWFLSNAAASSQANVRVSNAISHSQVGDVMSQDCPTVDGNIDLRTFAEEHLLRTGRRCFVVSQNGQHLGLVAIGDLKRIERARWPFTTVADVAVPFDSVPTVTPAAPLTQALELMAKENITQLPVLSNGKLVGVVSRGQVVRLIQTQAELKAA
jgi:Zn-dependent protease